MNFASGKFSWKVLAASTSISKPASILSPDALKPELVPPHPEKKIDYFDALDFTHFKSPVQSCLSLQKFVLGYCSPHLFLLKACAGFEKYHPHWALH